MTTNSKRMKRGAYGRHQCVFVGVWLPSKWIKLIDEIVAKDDLDRSKVLRKALQRQLNMAS